MDRKPFLRCVTKLILVILSVSSALTLSAQSGLEIKGKVTDKNGDPLPGAAILVVGQKGNGAIADIDGTYSVTVPGRKSKLQFVYLGYVEQVVTVGNTNVIGI